MRGAFWACGAVTSDDDNLERLQSLISKSSSIVFMNKWVNSRTRWVWRHHRISVMFSANRIINPTLSERKSRFQAPLILWICLWIVVLLAFLPFNNLRREFLVISFTLILLHLRFSPIFYLFGGENFDDLTSVGRLCWWLRQKLSKQITSNVASLFDLKGFSWDFHISELKGKGKCFSELESPGNDSQNKLHYSCDAWEKLINLPSANRSQSVRSSGDAFKASVNRWVQGFFCALLTLILPCDCRLYWRKKQPAKV